MFEQKQRLKYLPPRIRVDVCCRGRVWVHAGHLLMPTRTCGCPSEAECRVSKKSIETVYCVVDGWP